MLNAEGAGAKAAVIVDTGEGLHGMAGDGSGRQPSIPSVLVPASSGSQVLELLNQQGALHASLHTSLDDFAAVGAEGTDDEDQCAAPDGPARAAAGGQAEIPVRVEMLFTPKVCAC